MGYIIGVIYRDNGRDNGKMEGLYYLNRLGGIVPLK